MTRTRHHRLAHQRGSAMILVVSLIIVLLIVALGFVSVTGLQRITGGAANRAGNTDVALEAAKAKVGRAIAEDFRLYLNPVTTNSAELAARYMTYPDPTYHPFLSWIEPADIDPVDGDWDRWPQITVLDSNADGVADARDFFDAQTMTSQASIDPGEVTYVLITDGGSGYTSAPSVTFSGGGGSSAAATASIANGRVVAVAVTAAGSGYTSKPGVSFSGGAGTGAAAVAQVGNDLTAPFVPATASGQRFMVDADGEGYVDSRWTRLNVSSVDGIEWLIATKITDESGRANLNVGTEAEPHRAGANVYGETPADYNLKRLLGLAEFNAGLAWGAPYVDPGVPPLFAANAVGFNASGDSLGNAGSMRFFYDRLGYFYGLPGYATNNYSGMLPVNDRARGEAWGFATRFLDSPPVGIYPFGTSDLAEVRLRFGTNSRSVSSLENYLDAQAPDGIGVLRAGRVESGNSNYPLTRAQLRADVRHLLTTYSGARDLAPRWLTGITTTNVDYTPNTGDSKLYLPALTSTSTNSLRLQYADAITQALARGSVPYDASAARPRDAAVAMTANLVALREPDPYNAYNPRVADGGTTYYPQRLQPFISEVSALIVYTDTSGGPPDAGGNPTPNQTIEAPTEETGRYLVVELSNPWPVPIDMASFALSVNGGARVNLVAASMMVAANNHFLVYTAGVPDLTTAVTPGVEASAAKTSAIAINWTGSNNCDVDLYYVGGATPVLIDRIRWEAFNYPDDSTANSSGPSPVTWNPAATANWPLPPLANTNPPSGNALDPLPYPVAALGNRYVLSASLQRDDKLPGGGFPSVGSPVGFPKYIYENKKFNFAETTAPADIAGTGAPIPFQNQMSGYGNNSARYESVGSIKAFELPSPSGAVQGVTITNRGSGYSAGTPPTITFSAPAVGTTAAGVVTVGYVQSIAVTTGGAGYQAAPEVILTGGGGVGATAVATISGGAVAGITVLDGGEGYSGAPTVVLRGGSPTTPATLAVTAATDAIAKIRVTNGGSGYTAPPTATIAPPGSGTTATASSLMVEQVRTVGDLGTVLTYAHKFDGTTRTTIAEQLGQTPLPPPATPVAEGDDGAPSLYRFENGRLRLTEFVAGSPPEMPVALGVFEQFTTLLGSPTNHGNVYGVININTAPRRVLRMLPYLLGKAAGGLGPDTSVAARQALIADALVAYREKGQPYGEASTLPDGVIDFSNRATAAGVSTGTTDLRTPLGFAGVGEPLMVRRDPLNPLTPEQRAAAGDGSYLITRLAPDGANNTTADGDFSGDAVIDDVKEELLHYRRISNLITVRSDVFTAHVVLQGRKNVGTSSVPNWQPVVERRFVVGFDRSNVDGSNTPGRTMPRVLFFAEER